MPLDFDEIKRNAQKDGIPLSEISIVYRGLTDQELARMKEFMLITHRSEDTMIGRFTEDGQMLFPDKTVAVHKLSAD
jgi:hypothetical protein